MRISVLLYDRVDVPVAFGGHTFSVSYRPAAYSVELDMSVRSSIFQADEMKRQAPRLVELIAAWELTDDNDEPLPITYAIFLEMPFALFTAIVTAIQLDAMLSTTPKATRSEEED